MSKRNLFICYSGKPIKVKIKLTYLNYLYFYSRILNLHSSIFLIFIYYIFNISLSMFDQRMLRPSSDHFYFQLAPKVLIIQDKALARELKTSNTEFKLKLQKGMKVFI